MWVKIFLLFFVFSFLFRTDHSFDQDLGRHIKSGEVILDKLSIPRTNLFSYTNPDFLFINTHWLFGVFVYLFAQANMLPFLLVLKAIIILLSVWITLKLIPKENQVLLLPLGFIFLHVIRDRVELRPEIFSFLFTASTYFILERFGQMNHDRRTFVQRSKVIFLLPFIQLLWINTHIYFFVGLALQAIFLIYMGYNKLRLHLGGVSIKILAIIFILSVLVSLINPNGLNGLLYPLNVTKNYGYTIVENQTMFFLEQIQFRDVNFLFVKLSLGIIVASIIFSVLSSLRKDTTWVKNILLATFGATLALLNVRSFPYLVFISLPATMMLLGETRKNIFTSFLFLISCFLLLLESFLYLNGSYYKATDSQHQVGLDYIESGRGALDFVSAHDLPGPIFNNFDIGSYIVYRVYPNLKVFVDGRPEAYPAQFFTDVYIPIQSDYKNFAEAEKYFNYKSVIFSHTDQTTWAKNFLANIIKDPKWKIVYLDGFMIVLTETEIVEERELKVVDLANLNPSMYSYTNHRSYLGLGIFLLNNQFQNGSLFIQKAYQMNPQSPVAKSAFGGKSKNYFFW